MPPLPTILFIVQFLATLFMTGVIWFVQIVHYPLFTDVGPGHLNRYETLHARRTSWVVFPPMLLELLTAIAALYPPLRPSFITPPNAIVLAALVLIIWITTGIGHVPLHSHLGRQASTRPTRPDASLIALLVRLNWVRTLAWTAGAILLTAALLHALPS